MVQIRLRARINEHHQIELLEPIPPHVEALQEVSVVIDQMAEEINPEFEWTEELLANVMRPEPKTGAEIVAMLAKMGPAYLHIMDSASWVENQRNQHKERSQW